MNRAALFYGVALALALVIVGLDKVHAQPPTTDVIGVHDMGVFGQSPVRGGLTTCQYCHAPHSAQGDIKPLWSQKLSAVTNYTLYSDPSMVNVVQEPMLGSASNLCLSCHDGTVAPGQTSPYGTVKMSGSMNSQDVFGTNLQSMHPFNFKLPLQSAPNLLPSLTSGGVTGNPAVKLINGNVQCTTCHEPHVESIDPVAGDFLVMNNASSALCLACHVSTPGATVNAVGHSFRSQSGIIGSLGQTPKGKFNTFTGWYKSAHEQASYRVSKKANLGPYGNTRQNGCLSCHAPHKAPGTASLLTGPVLNGPVLPVAGMDSTTANCISCHAGGSTISPVIPNVFAEFEKTTGHPFPKGRNVHSAKETEVLNNNRHATCVDCHDPHATTTTPTFAIPKIRGSQYGAVGISASDGATVISPAQEQFETCLRCHGTSAGKQILPEFGYLPTRAVSAGDPLNLIPQFSGMSRSSHPVMHDSNSPYPQPSLRKYMLNLDGHTQGRMLGPRLLCTDCHNADDNREFGGSGPNGPHGSSFPHILERRYEFSRVAPGVPPAAGPGTTIMNLLPAITDPSSSSPYSLCGKCHDLTKIMSNVSFAKHSLHISAGFSCSVCHTAHGNGATSANISGERLVNFDLGVVAENDKTKLPVSYSRSTGTCTLKCHNIDHNPDGSVSTQATSKFPRKGVH